MKYLILLLLFFSVLIAQGQGTNKLVTIIDEINVDPLTFKKNVLDTVLSTTGETVYLFEIPGKTNGRFRIEYLPDVIYLDNIPGVTVANQLVNTYVPGSPTWTHAIVTGHWSNTISFSNVANSSLTTKFTGTKIEWIHEMDKHLGIAAISIDNGPETLVDTYNATNLKQQSKYTSPALTQGLHTIKLRVTGTKNAAATGFYLVHDAWKVTP